MEEYKTIDGDKMDINTLCNKIELQPLVKERVLSFIDEFDFQTVDEIQKGYFTYSNMKEALGKTRALLGEDEDGIKILTCMLRSALDTYEEYHKKGISDDVYYATMRCFTRFIDETNKMIGHLSFDRYWWTARQIGCHLFRIGELEYEIKPTDKETVISIHIPSDASFSPISVDESMQAAREFFAKYYPELSNAKYCCQSWLLDNQLKGMLGNNSNILNFQNRFEIIDEGEEDTEFIEWLFNTKSLDYATLPENTSLQINMKKHLLAGGVIKNSYGIIK